MNDKIYIHELIDIIGHNRARYMQHMTANWCPIARDERDMLCFGVWGTVGSTGRWPEVVNMWELNGWDGLAANFAHELAAPSMQDPALAQWWSVAAELRHGGLDRVLIPEPANPTIEELTAAGTHGAVYAHELVRVPVGGARDFLDGLNDVARPIYEALGLTAIGSYRVAMQTDSEAIAIWAIPDWDTWSAFEQAWDGAAFTAWRTRLGATNVDLRRTLMVDAPLAPLRTGRQPQIEDRRALEEL
ncbi:MAG TPA: NIPSNAP family containing protein [Acidimicrobiia bacterium]|nr:NIPSNAP family containing protein [Acidimicrobiia bacterium]